MTEIAQFVRREHELKETLPFAEWLRHIRTSHLEALRLLSGESEKPVTPRAGTLKIEVLHSGERGERVLSVYELPAHYSRIVVDLDRIHGEVWGLADDGEGAPKQMNATLVSRGDGLMLG